MLKSILIPACALALAIGFSSCDKEQIQSDESFFSLEDGHSWTYQRWQIMPTGDDVLRQVLDTITLRVEGDTIVDGHSYKLILGNDLQLDKIIRKEGTKYFGRHHELYGNYSKEYMFLDTSVPAGSSWTHIKEGEFIDKTVYLVKAKNSTRQIGGKSYHDVIEIEASYYYKELEEEKLWLKALHYYSKDGGEIYNYYPYPVSGRFADVESFLISTNN